MASSLGTKNKHEDSYIAFDSIPVPQNSSQPADDFEKRQEIMQRYGTPQGRQFTVFVSGELKKYGLSLDNASLVNGREISAKIGKHERHWILYDGGHLANELYDIATGSHPIYGWEEEKEKIEAGKSVNGLETYLKKLYEARTSDFNETNSNLAKTGDSVIYGNPKAAEALLREYANLRKKSGEDFDDTTIDILLHGNAIAEKGLMSPRSLEAIFSHLETPTALVLQYTAAPHWKVGAPQEKPEMFKYFRMHLLNNNCGSVSADVNKYNFFLDALNNATIEKPEFHPALGIVDKSQRGYQAELVEPETIRIKNRNTHIPTSKGWYQLPSVKLSSEDEEFHVIPRLKGGKVQGFYQWFPEENSIGPRVLLNEHMQRQVMVEYDWVLSSIYAKNIEKTLNHIFSEAKAHQNL